MLRAGQGIVGQFINPARRLAAASNADVAEGSVQTHVQYEHGGGHRSYVIVPPGRGRERRQQVYQSEGLIATIPHKPAVLQLVDGATDRARQVGAVNVVRIGADGHTFGDILDGEGLVAGLRAAGQQIAGRRALVVGSGGVGSAIAFAVASAGARDVSVSDVAPERVQQLAARLTAAGYAASVSVPDASGFDLVINASPAGMQPGDPLPIDLTRLGPDAIVADVVIHSGLTPLLTAASHRGCFVQSGSVMSDHQVAEMVEFFGFSAGDWSPNAIAQAISA